jgi:hypothetical protein
MTENQKAIRDTLIMGALFMVVTIVLTIIGVIG